MVILLFLFFGIAIAFNCSAQTPVQVCGFLPFQDSIEIVLRKNKDVFWSGTLVNGYFEITVDSMQEGEYSLTWSLPANDIERQLLRRDRNGKAMLVETKSSGITKSIYVNPQESQHYTLRMNGRALPENFARLNRVDLILSHAYGLTIESNSPESRVYNEIRRLNYWYRDTQKRIQDSLYIVSAKVDKIPIDFYNESIRLNDSLNRSESVERSIRIAEENPDVATSLFVFFWIPSEYLSYHEARLWDLLNRIPEDIKQRPLFARASMRLRAAVGLRVGDRIPTIVGETPERAVMDTLQIDYNRSDYTLLEFWATWCVPCREMNPEWNRLLDKYGNLTGGKSLQIVGISLDIDRGHWLGAIEKDSMQKWIHISDLKDGFKGLNATSFGIDFIPFNLLLDQKGRIVQKNIRPEQLRELLETYRISFTQHGTDGRR